MLFLGVTSRGDHLCSVTCDDVVVTGDNVRISKELGWK